MLQQFVGVDWENVELTIFEKWNLTISLCQLNLFEKNFSVCAIISEAVVKFGFWSRELGFFGCEFGRSGCGRISIVCLLVSLLSFEMHEFG